ncbi:response regulator [Oribacterium sp. WCC10]|uniref:response regulator n=1 Tax=Oribacterium sp. WCC10 TaxID=1855343 RepID=UPI0008EB83F7|nr:response regulator [Oribacterium sp. WCC10]SFG43395.1 Two-component response regulator, YesN/AraC family, consists of REC and AraC-type DNA-binding domains [Oribacterium sp. WCC10]
MYKVMLVDDESAVLDILKNRINWQELGVDSLLYAPDGQTALKKMAEQKIDIVISDIQMPGMNGLDLSGQIKKLYPDTRILLLTAYGEFEYARKAIQLGVENYLLKPVVKEEIEQNIRNTLDNLYRKRLKDPELLKENVLRRWILGTISGEELADRAGVLGINMYMPSYAVLCFSGRNKEIPTGIISEGLKKEFAGDDIFTLWDEKGKYTAIVAGQNIDKEILKDKAEKLIKDNGLENNIIIAIGAVVNDAENIHISYRIASDLIEMNDSCKAGAILTQITVNGDMESELIMEEVRTFFFIGDDEIIKNGIERLAIKFYKNQERGKALYNFMKCCSRVIIQEFEESEKPQVEAYFTEGIPDESISDSMSLENYISKIKEVFDFENSIFKKCFDSLSPIVRLTMQTIHSSVLEGKGISIKEFCSRNGMNPAYLGHIFKKETGYFFNDYLMNSRIRRSVILLRNPSRKIKDIAEQVGFSSTSYFVKCFRAVKGVSPVQYRIDNSENGR